MALTQAKQALSAAAACCVRARSPHRARLDLAPVVCVVLQARCHEAPQHCHGQASSPLLPHNCCGPGGISNCSLCCSLRCSWRRRGRRGRLSDSGIGAPVVRVGGGLDGVKKNIPRIKRITHHAPRCSARTALQRARTPALPCSIPLPVPRIQPAPSPSPAFDVPCPRWAAAKGGRTQPPRPPHRLAAASGACSTAIARSRASGVHAVVAPTTAPRC